MDDISGRVALVTGASRGIGRAIALALGAAGVDVAVNYRERQTEAEAVAARIRDLGRRSAAVRADVSKSAEVARMSAEIEGTLGAVDIVVNNAGIARAQKAEEISEADWNELISVNLTSCFLVSQAFLPAMRKRGWGRLIFLSSVAAQIGGVVGPHYAASKAGMIGLAHGYANLLVKEGITSNAIAPALVETEMVTSNLNAKPGLIPAGRYGRAEEIAGIAVMLARNGFITGQTISANGGLYMS